MRSNKKLIIVISIVCVLAVASAVGAYLFLMTDVFKSNKELFSKYLSQNTVTFQKMADLKVVNFYKQLSNESKYESKTKMKIAHSEGGEVSNPINNVSAELNLQKDSSEPYFYVDGKIYYADEKYLEVEAIKEKELYGVRFTDAVKQFVTVKKDEKLETVATDLGMTVVQIGILTNFLDESEQTVINEEVASIKDKYLNIITTAISNGTFKKQKEAMITYNNMTVETNAYSVEISSEQVRNVLVGILNNLPESINKEDAQIWLNGQTELPTVKITVYEKQKQTIRTVAEIGVCKIIIENTENNGELKSKISYLDNNNAIETSVDIVKKNTEKQESLEVTINVIDEEETYAITFLENMQLENSIMTLNAEVAKTEGITTESISIENKVTIGNEVEKTLSLNKGNNIVLNDLSDQKRSEIIELLTQLVKQETTVRLNLLERNLRMINEEAVEPDKISQVEINKFNSKFEFYTGEEVSAENIKMLLEVVKNHLGSFEEVKKETTEDVVEGQENIETPEVEESEEDKKLDLKLIIERDSYNEEGVNQILEKISNNKKYKVLITYKEENGLIDYITITEI